MEKNRVKAWEAKKKKADRDASSAVAAAEASSVPGVPVIGTTTSADGSINCQGTSVGVPESATASTTACTSVTTTPHHRHRYRRYHHRYY
jgi:hypothetical protein